MDRRLPTRSAFCNDALGQLTMPGGTKGTSFNLTLLGLLLGIGGALGLTQLLASLLFGVGGRDPLTMTAVAGILGLVALLACLLPARRSTKVDPLIALRCE